MIALRRSKQFPPTFSKDNEGLGTLATIIIIIVAVGAALGIRDGLPSALETITASPLLFLGGAVVTLAAFAIWLYYRSG